MISELKEDPRITRLRDDLGDYFRQRALDAGIEINPTLRNQRDIIMAMYVYEEEGDGRLFIVSPLGVNFHRQFFATLEDGNHAFEIDAFTTQTGFDYETSLLSISVRPDAAHFPKLWEAYLKWMHEGADEKSVMAVLRHS